MPGNGGGRVDDLDSRTGHTLDDLAQERVVGASQHDPVCSRRHKRQDAFPDCLLGLRSVQNAVLDQLHEPLADVFGYLCPISEHLLDVEVSGCFESAGGRKHSDHSGLRAQGCRLDCRFHTDELDGKLLAQDRDRRCGGRVAGHDNDLRSFRNKQPGDFPRPVPDELHALLPVGTVGVVRVVDVLLLRENPENLPKDGQPAGT